MKSTRILIILFILRGPLFAQTEIPLKNNIRLDLGYNQGFVKDLSFSPLNYTQGGKLLGLNYQKNSANGKNKIETGLHLSTGKIKTDASDYFTASYILATFDASFLRKIRPSDDTKLSYFVGGEYKSNIQYLDWRGQDAISFIATHGVAVKGLVVYNLGEKQQLESSIAIPVFQNLVRPPYNVIDEFISENKDNILKIVTHGTSSTLNKYQAIEWKTRYKYAVSKHFQLEAAYNMNLQHVSDVHKLTQLNNQITTGFTFKF
jgi:hypothetical protein